jgi:hypothetical protein
MRFLEKFMESLTANTIIKNSQIFYDFLTIEKESDFNIKKKEYLKLKAPTKLSEMRSVDGEVVFINPQLRSKVSKEVESATEGIKNYLHLNEILLKKLTSSHKQLFLEMNQVSLRMTEISEIYSQLHAVSYKYADVIFLFIRLEHHGY